MQGQLAGWFASRRQRPARCLRAHGLLCFHRRTVSDQGVAMTQARTQLAATDFSAPARHALERAAQLAHTRPGAGLTLAHFVSGSALDALHRMLPGEAVTLETQLRALAGRSLDEMAAHLSEHHTYSIATAVTQGSAAAALVVHLEKRQADLLVMGARGKHFVVEMLLGST